MWNTDKHNPIFHPQPEITGMTMANSCGRLTSHKNGHCYGSHFSGEIPRRGSRVTQLVGGQARILVWDLLTLEPVSVWHCFDYLPRLLCRPSATFVPDTRQPLVRPLCSLPRPGKGRSAEWSPCPAHSLFRKRDAFLCCFHPSSKTPKCSRHRLDVCLLPKSVRLPQPFWNQKLRFG